MANYLKEERLIDKEYLANFKEKHCAVCYSKSGVCGHHIRKNGGTGIKSGDNETIPLCFVHHSELHNKGEKSFYKRYSFILGDDVVLYAKNLYQKYLDKHNK